NGLWVMGGSHFTTVNDNNPMDSASNATKRYVFTGYTYPFVNPSNSVSVSAVDLNGKPTIILPGSGDPTIYRDYYFENINLTGGAYFPGGIFNYNGKDGSGNNYSKVQFGGGSVIYGSDISGNFGANGNPLIKLPNNANNVAPGDWSLWWGFRNGWYEVNGA